MAKYFQEFCAEYDQVMALSEYNNTQHEILATKLESLDATFKNSRSLKDLQDSMKSLIEYYDDYVNNLKDSGPRVDVLKERCNEYFSNLKDSYQKFVVFVNNFGVERIQSLEGENVKLLERIKHLEELQKNTEWDLNNSKDEVNKKEKELDNLYTLYANENSEKEHIIKVFQYFIDKKNSELKVTKNLLQDLTNVLNRTNEATQP